MPPTLPALTTDRTECFQLVGGQVLGFADEDGQPAVLLLRSLRKIPDQLAEGGLEPPRIRRALLAERAFSARWRATLQSCSSLWSDQRRRAPAGTG